MSGSLGRPNWGADIADLQRRIGMLERRTTPRPAPVSEEVALPVRLMGEGAISIGSAIIYATLELPNLDGSDPNIRWGDSLAQVFSTGPYFLGTGATIYPRFYVPDFSAGTLAFNAELLVWNPALTNRLRATYASVIVTPGQSSWVPSSTVGPIPSAEISGSDLTINTDRRVRTQLGGYYLARLHISVVVTPTP